MLLNCNVFEYFWHFLFFFALRTQKNGQLFGLKHLAFYISAFSLFLIAFSARISAKKLFARLLTGYPSWSLKFGCSMDSFTAGIHAFLLLARNECWPDIHRSILSLFATGASPLELSSNARVKHCRRGRVWIRHELSVRMSTQDGIRRQRIEIGHVLRV